MSDSIFQGAGSLSSSMRRDEFTESSAISAAESLTGDDFLREVSFVASYMTFPRTCRACPVVSQLKLLFNNSAVTVTHDVVEFAVFIPCDRDHHTLTALRIGQR